VNSHSQGHSSSPAISLSPSSPPPTHNSEEEYNFTVFESETSARGVIPKQARGKGGGGGGGGRDAYVELRMERVIMLFQN
jgi:hypothetical protein